MDVVIKIPKEDYEKMRGYLSYTNYTEYGQKLLSYLRENGTPLPEHHGRLIDADALEYTCNADECGMLTGCNHCQYHIVTEHEIDHAPTIIEGE